MASEALTAPETATTGTPSAATGIPGRCGAHSKRNNRPCINFPVAGAKRCRMHGGIMKVAEESPQYRHGGKSRYFPSSRLPEVVAKATELLEPDARKRLLAGKVAEKVVIRQGVPAEGDSIETWLRLDAAETRDVDALTRLEESEKDRAPTIAPTFTVAAIGSPTVTLVRGPDGEGARLLRADGLTLLECDGGAAWRPAESFELIEGVTGWRPLVQLPPASEGNE